MSNVTIPLLGLCDTAISGHLGSELFLAAIAVGSVMLNVVFWIFGFLRMGTTGLTATSLGANDANEVRRVFSRAFFIGVSAGILLIVFRYPIMEGLLKICGSNSEIRESVEEYFLIRIWGAPALLATMVVTGWFVGMQSTVYPLIISVGMNIANIALSFILVFYSDMGFIGVAAGTLISNWFGLLLSIACMIWFLKKTKIFSTLREIFNPDGLKKFFSVNSNLFIRSLCIICVTMGVTAASGRLGPLTLAVNVIVMQFFQFFSFFMDGFAFSGEALIGLYAGERNPERLRLSYRALLMWTLGIGVIFTFIYLFFNGNITSLLTDSTIVREGVRKIEIFIIMIPLVSAWAFIYDGFYVGLTDTRLMMFSTLIASIFFFIISFLSVEEGEVFINVSNNDMIWTGFLVYLGIRGVVLASAWKGRLKRRLRMEFNL